MAEAVAGFYAVETVVEGAALGALAVARSTAPLHLNFRKIASPAAKGHLARAGHSLNVVKGKAYLIGGHTMPALDQNNSPILALTLPVASSADGEGDLTPRDFQTITPEFKDAHHPLAREKSLPNPPDFARTGHSTTAVDDKLYVWGGVNLTNQALCSEDFVVFDTLTSSYHVLQADLPKCLDGVPPSRTFHTAVVSPYPQPNSLPGGPTIDAHGTIIVHGGRIGTTECRDTWAFDVGTRVWTRLPELPEAGPAEIAGEGAMTYSHGRLWRLGDGFGRVLYLDLDEPSGASSSSPELVKGIGEWQVISFGTEASDPAATEGDKPKHASSNTEGAQLPMPRSGASVIPVTTGAGRQYLLYFMGQVGESGDLNDFWSFQIDSEQTSAASIKDKIRDTVSHQTKNSWASGRHTWAKCEVGELNGKGDGHEQTNWPSGLRGFGSDNWSDQGGNAFVIWGGRHGDGPDAVVDEGWVVSVM